MAIEGVVCEREAKAHYGTYKEHSKYHFLLHLNLDRGARQEVDRDANESHAAQQMCPDVACLRVDAEYGREARAERG